MKEKYLIPPFPSEYAVYSEQEKFEKMEYFYKQKQEVYSVVECLEKECKKRMDAILEKQIDVKDMLLIFDKKEIQLLSQNTQDFNVLNRFCQIAEMEKALGEVSLLDNIHGMEDVVDYYQRCIFLIRRFEFDWEEDGDLLEVMSQKKVSYIALAELTCEKMIGQKVKAGCRIANYLYRNGYKREAVLFIMRLEQRLSYSEKKVMHFAMTLLDLGEHRLAYEVLMKHQNPNADIEELQNALSAML